MTPPNVDFLMRQRTAAVGYLLPPDFPDAGGKFELGFKGTVDWNSLSADGMRAMGFGSWKWDVTEDMAAGEREVVEAANKLCFG